jgi:hypothetical protein
MGRAAAAYQCPFHNFGNRSVQPHVPTSIKLPPRLTRRWNFESLDVIAAGLRHDNIQLIV